MLFFLAVVIHLFAAAVSSEYPSAGLVVSLRLWCIHLLRDTEGYRENLNRRDYFLNPKMFVT